MPDVGMGTNSVQYIRSQDIALAEGYKTTLREGSSVLVRVLKNNGGGRFTVSFAGSRFSVSSDRALNPGDVFKATVALSKDGTVLLKPESFLTSGSLPENPLASLFQTLNIPFDEISTKLFSFMQQLGVKIDRNFILRARDIASRFPGKESAAAEIAALLLEKGIEPDVKTVRKILVLAEGATDSSEEKHSGDSPAEDDAQHDAADGSAPNEAAPNHEGGAHQEPAHGDFQDGAADSAAHESAPHHESAPDTALSFFNKLFPNGLPQKEGLLSVVNHLKNTGGTHHWITVPYEWQDGTETAHGKINLLLDTGLGCTEKITVSCFKSGKKYFFVLYFNKSMVKEVHFCTLPPLLTDKILLSEKRMGELFGSGMNQGSPVSVIYSASAFTDGFCSNREEPVFFESEA